MSIKPLFWQQIVLDAVGKESIAPKSPTKLKVAAKLEPASAGRQ